MAHHCYILYSAKLDRYYVGETADISTRVHMHNIGFSTFTAKASDWEMYLTIPCVDREQALKIEEHVKRMKSRKYIENLSRYPEIIKKLLKKYDGSLASYPDSYRG